MEPWRNRIVAHKTVAASTLVANPGNARVHNNPQRAALGAVLDDVGWVAPVVVNRLSGLIVDGHLRVDEAAKRGEKVPVVYVELSDQEEAEILATLDPIGQMATYDLNALSALIELGNVDSAELLAMLDDVAGLDRSASSSNDDRFDGPTEPRIDQTEFYLMIECADEADQRNLMKRFDHEGLAYKAIMA